MGSQHPKEPKEPKQKSGQHSPQQLNEHNNSARSGETTHRAVDDDDDSAGSEESQHASTKNLETEPDRARHAGHKGGDSSHSGK